MSQRGRLEDGLKKYNLSLKEINDSGWKYCGGDEQAGSSHLNYFKTIFGDKPENIYGDLPLACECGIKITRHFFICSRNEDEMICLGSECIKRFIDNKGRTCDLCKQPHRNRKDNYCNKCRRRKRIYY